MATTTNDSVNSPRLESLIHQQFSESSSEEEEEVATELSLNWGKDREGLSFFIDLPQRIFAYLFYLITFSFLTGVVSKKSRKTYIILNVCKVICQMISFALMVGIVSLRTGLLIVYTLNRNCECGMMCNQTSSAESTEVYVYLWEVGYDVISLSSLIYLFYYSHTSRNGTNPHKLIMSTRKNRTSVWRSQNSEHVRTGISIRGSTKFKTSVSPKSVFVMVWQFVLTLLIVLSLAAEGNSITCEINRLKDVYVKSGTQECLIYEIYEVLRAINALQRYLSPVIVCLLCVVACTKLETDIKLHSVSTFTNLIVSQSTTSIKEGYFDIVGRVNEYCDRFRAIISLNILCSVLGMGSIVLVRLFYGKGDLLRELWGLEAFVLLKLYATYFILTSCTWLAIDRISICTDLLSRFPDELMGFVMSKKNNVVELVNQDELNIIAISAKGTQGSLYSSQFLTLLRYSLILGLVALLIIAFEGSIEYKVPRESHWCLKTNH